MEQVSPAELMERSLERVVEALGDPCEPVFARFYARFPDARDAFVRLGLGSADKLQEQMFEQLIYCLTTWIARPEEVRIVLNSSVPHHLQTLEVMVEWYDGLIGSACAVLRGAVPAEAMDELALWNRIERELRECVRRSVER